MTNTIKVIEVASNQLSALQLISTQTFSETFTEHNTEEDMKLYIESNFNLSSLKTELDNSSSKFYFALDGEEVVGYLKINWGNAQSESLGNTSLELERIYVLKSYQGKNVGHALYQKALAVATELNFDFIWLGVWEKNERAIQFYKKNGLVEFDKHLFKLGKDLQTDLLMKFMLK
jgi:ribosomal protein S18 acetylase RimI-like enzyme